MVNITKKSAVAFLKSIVCRFGIPNHIIADNGTQFKSKLFQEYCEDIGIQLCFASVAHPRSNGQVERANAEVLRGLKTRTYNCLKKHGAKWVDELPCMLWGNRTTPSRATGEPHSSWSTELKHAFPRKFTWAHHGSRLLTNPCRNSCGAMMWTSLMKEGGEQQSEMQATTRRSGAIINGSCTVGSSGLVTSS